MDKLSITCIQDGVNIPCTILYDIVQNKASFYLANTCELLGTLYYICTPDSRQLIANACDIVHAVLGGHSTHPGA